MDFAVNFLDSSAEVVTSVPNFLQLYRHCLVQKAAIDLVAIFTSATSQKSFYPTLEIDDFESIPPILETLYKKTRFLSESTLRSINLDVSAPNERPDKRAATNLIEKVKISIQINLSKNDYFSCK
jgi:hypothetical protein